MRNGYYILSFSLDGGETWQRSVPMLWRSMRAKQRRLHRLHASAISVPSFA